MQIAMHACFQKLHALGGWLTDRMAILRGALLAQHAAVVSHSGVGDPGACVTWCAATYAAAAIDTLRRAWRRSWGLLSPR
jgi:hypothetical protein